MSADAVCAEGRVPHMASGRKPARASGSTVAASFWNVREARLGLIWREEKLRLGSVRLGSVRLGSVRLAKGSGEMAASGRLAAIC